MFDRNDICIGTLCAALFLLNISASTNILAMKRLFTFLIISILFSQSAWAFHDTEFNNLHKQMVTQAQTADQNDEANVSYDHCGHASAHLVGLLSKNNFDANTGSKCNLISVKNITTSMSYQPPVPPPTS